MHMSFNRSQQLALLMGVILLLYAGALPAQKRIIRGYVMDSLSKETMIGASLYDKISGKGCVTNDYGYYSLVLDAGEVDLRISYVGYNAKEIRFNLRRDTLISFPMTPVRLKTLTVSASRSTVSAKSSQMSVVEIPVKQIQAMPTLFGEADVLKAIQLLPGVQNGSEGSAGLYVRGGGPDENLLLLDGVPVYNVNHMMGFFSVFNPDALKNVTLYKGSFPARFGGRLSSVVDVRMKEGDMREYHGNASIGVISSKINVEGPIVKDKLSFNVSFRRTYSDLLMKPVVWAATRIDALDMDVHKASFGYYFYDLNAKFNWKISDKDRVYLSLYSGDDAVYAKIRYKDIEERLYKNEEYFRLKWKWGNKVTALRWNRLLTPKLFMDASANYTQYRHSLGISINETDITYNPYSKETYDMEMRYLSSIHDATGRVDFTCNPNTSHDIRFGGAYTYHLFRPETQSFSMEEKEEDYYDKMDTTFNVSLIGAHESVLYIEDDIRLNDLFKMNAGLHYSTFSVQHTFYQSLQPRLSIRALLNSHFSIKAGYAYMQQYLHLLSNSSVSLPTDLWVPVTARIEPMKAHQVSLGCFYELPKGFDCSVEGYYKQMDNLLEYKDGSTFFGSSEGWESKVCLGKGWAYGVEFLLQRTYGSTTGWVAYTWAHADRKFDREGEEINDGKVFPAKYDRRHDISLTLQHSFSETFDFSASWVFSTGNCGTLGMQLYPSLENNGYGSVIAAIERNNFRFANYHRLDVSFSWHKQLRHGIRTWNVSIYNAYAHNNPFLVYTDYDTHGHKRLKQLCIFPFIPSLSYSYKF